MPLSDISQCISILKIAWILLFKNNFADFCKIQGVGHRVSSNDKNVNFDGPWDENLKKYSKYFYFGQDFKNCIFRSTG